MAEYAVAEELRSAAGTGAGGSSPAEVATAVDFPAVDTGSEVLESAVAEGS